MSKYIEKIKVLSPKRLLSKISIPKASLPKTFSPKLYFPRWKQGFSQIPRQKKIEYAFRGAIVAMMAVALFSSYTALTGKSITVSNTYNGKELPIYCVKTDKNHIALSFDAAWGNEDTQQILDILKQHDIRVTFFMTGGWVEEYPDDVRAILAAGHDLANHGENHKHMSRLNNEQIKDEILKVHEKVKKLTGYEMDLFRPPYGDYDNEVVKMAASIGYFTIQWDIDTLVTKKTSLNKPFN